MNNHDVLITNEIDDIEARAERVSALLRKSATLWLEIAREVHDAKQSLSPDAYSIFLERASLTTTIADKMPRIAKASELYSDEAKRHIQKLEGWSTLYEVAKLTAPEKKEFFDTLNKEPDTVVSRAFIQKFKKSKQASVPPMIVAEIRVSKDDVQRIDYDQFIKFKEMLDEFARHIDRMSPAISFQQKESVINEIEETIMSKDTDDEQQMKIAA